MGGSHRFVGPTPQRVSLVPAMTLVDLGLPEGGRFPGRRGEFR